eukprot:6184730-Pleurochrysis_carterae.AAC.3
MSCPGAFSRLPTDNDRVVLNHKSRVLQNASANLVILMNAKWHMVASNMMNLSGNNERSKRLPFDNQLKLQPAEQSAKGRMS